MVRVRTIPKAVKEIKAKDPGSYINERLLRRWIKDGIIKPINGSYTYTLINLDELERLLRAYLHRYVEKKMKTLQILDVMK